MRVLISAIACHPHLGSEAKVGWDAARAISRISGIEQCHVMTNGANQEAITRAQAAGEAEGIWFHFFGEPYRYHPNRLMARLQSWLIYRNWQLKALERAKDLHQEHKFNLAHHVTYATWRIPSRLWSLPIPFVFGPVGGGASMPVALRPMLGTVARGFELLRDVATSLATNSKDLKLCCTRSAAVVAADRATTDFLVKHGAKNIRTFCQVFFSTEQASRFVQRGKPVGASDSELRIFAGGNLEARKGTMLALQALARLKRNGVAFKYVYGGGGPDTNSMLKLAQDLGIAGEVLFHDGFAGPDYESQLAKSDVYLLPSLRETAGITMMESVLAGCYPVVLAGTGAGDIVQRTGGAAIQADSPDEVVDKITQQLEWCHRHRREMRNQAGEAAEKMRILYSEEAYQRAILEIYVEVLERRCHKL